MAHRVSVASGNWTTAGTWKVADGTSLLDAQNVAQALTTTFASSAAFAPGAITVEGLAVKVAFRHPTPTAAMEVRLAVGGVAVAGTTVSINATDIPTEQGFSAGATVTGCPYGWFYLQFASPVTLLAATNYTLQARITASSNQVSLFRNATGSNWARMLVTSTAGAPAAGDSMFIVKTWTGAGASTAYTVTVDETAATDYGSGDTILASLGIGDGCALEFPTTGDQILRLSGNINLWGSARLTMGTAASPVATGASATIEFDCASNGDFGITAYPQSQIDLNGSPRTAGKLVTWCLLNTDEAAGSTSLGVDTDTGWLSGDDVTIGSTTRTNTETEDRVLNGAAGASSMDVTVGLTNDHSGTVGSQGEVALFTRNVTIRATGAFSWYFRDGQDAARTYTWTAFRVAGGPGNSNWSVTMRASGEVAKSRAFEFCAFAELASSMQGSSIEGATTTYNDCVFRASVNLSSPGGMFYNVRASATVTRCAMFYTGTVQNNGLTMVGAVTLVVRDSRFCGAQVRCPIAIYGFGTYFSLDIEDCEFHAAGVGSSPPIECGAPDRFGAFRVVNTRFWRNNMQGIGASSAGRCDLLVQGCYFIGNATSHANLPSGAQAEPVVRFVDCDFESDASFPTSTGVMFGTIWTGRAEFQNCRFSQVLAHATNDVGRTGTVSDMALYGSILFNNCLFGAATPVASAVTGQPGGYGRFSYMNEGGVVDAHRTLTQFGTIENQQAVFNTAAPSEQLTPTAAADIGVRGLRSSPVFKPVPAGQSVTFSVFVRRSAAHNGDMPQMIVWANGQGGWTDTRATFAGGTDVWVELTCTVGPAVSDTVAEACVEVDGDAGSVYLDDWTAVVA